MTLEFKKKLFLFIFSVNLSTPVQCANGGKISMLGVNPNVWPTFKANLFWPHPCQQRQQLRVVPHQCHPHQWDLRHRHRQTMLDQQLKLQRRLKNSSTKMSKLSTQSNSYREEPSLLLSHLPPLTSKLDYLLHIGLNFMKKSSNYCKGKIVLLWLMIIKVFKNQFFLWSGGPEGALQNEE